MKFGIIGAGVLVNGDDFNYAKQFSGELRRRVALTGRAPEDLLIMPTQ